ncbi:hypothetical protein BDV96DRAFT_652560 [Lophiotrema nucula]|uniref:Protein kinase domain-containing protein n=1 Tax=Lophiotrema nucula TaxID=690887 RepID=A0A6A5YMV5_9PLEO|nr:hypothetical protein BDV96DRAFT_652560 [Lophiotrema nucula]
MDFAYSPHRETGGTMHLPSPTHRHSYHLEGFSSIQQLRRSLSRSPSKPSRFHLRTGNSNSPGSPISPLALARAFSPKPVQDTTSDSPTATPAPAASKKRFTLRRSAPFRSSPRTRTASKSPRRALAESTDQGNASPFAGVRRTSGEENMPSRRPSDEYVEKFGTEQKPPMRFDLNDEPIKFEFARSRPESNAPGANIFLPQKSSPLKRSDGVMNLESYHVNSPLPKRRSLHGASFGADFDIFDHGPSPRTSSEEQQRPHDVDYSFSSPAVKSQSPLRKGNSLRKSTLSQRYGPNANRPKPAFDGEFAIPGPAASKTRNRMSLDSALAYGVGNNHTPFRAMPVLRGGAGGHQPHPLSNALTPSSSTSSMADHSPTYTPTHTPPHAPPTAAPRKHVFSRSLPIGANRPQPSHDSQSSEGSFETPMAYKTAKPNPAAFLSTGLLSKKNRNAEEPAAGAVHTYVMPDTPSKRNSFPPVTASSPSFSRSIFGEPSQPRHEFGTPSTPFSFHASKMSNESFNKGGSIFGSLGNNHQRRSSFASIDGDDNAHSPTANHMTDSQSSNDDMPPTPTKANDGSGRRSKESSLRRRTFKQRTALAADTFAQPADSATPSIDIPQPMNTQSASLFGSSPHTPQESFVPDASRLSISGTRRESLPFNTSIGSNSFPPATPTTPREHSSYFGNTLPIAAPIVGLTQNDVDTSLTSRFDSYSFIGNGEFSTVYKAENAAKKRLNFSTPPPSQVFAVKKTKKPYTGPQDQAKKLREVEILSVLRGHEHVLRLEGHWEHKQHLYIQTEYCENGNLMDFLQQAGEKSRLDDFRIWKILLELTSGVKHIHDNGFIHLDLKPANILIDWEGVLKIGDFGLASSWPAPANIDGEGDRHYLAPEALSGRYDKPADVYALGTVMCEIAANIILPENGTSWQRLRSGDFTELPSLTWSSESSLNRDLHGEPITEPENVTNNDDPLRFIRIPSAARLPDGLIDPPSFMIDPDNNDSMDKLVKWMMNQDPDHRPTIDQVYHSYGCQWVEQRRRAGATVYEGNWGPADDVLDHFDHPEVDMADMMDTS